MGKIKKGDIVTVALAYCYTRWARFAWRHPQYMLHYAYGHFPYEERKYEVIGVHRDVIVVRGMECKLDKKANPIYFVQMTGVGVVR